MCYLSVHCCCLCVIGVLSCVNDCDAMKTPVVHQEEDRICRLEHMPCLNETPEVPLSAGALVFHLTSVNVGTAGSEI
jgi:hypothetical protein